MIEMKLLKKDLLAKCKELNIRKYSKLTKQELIDLIKKVEEKQENNKICLQCSSKSITSLPRFCSQKCKDLYIKTNLILEETNLTLEETKTFLPIFYNRISISVEDINTFSIISTKATNDMYNKIRENIITAIINNKIPEQYFIKKEWLNLKNAIFDFLKKLTNNKNYTEIECEHKGGRGNYKDFNIKVYYEDNTEEIYNTEFKYNTLSIEDTPQFNSPTKPSNFLSSSYEEYYYDNYLPKLASFSKYQMPDKHDYISHINSNNPKCMEQYKKLYELNKEFKKLANECFYNSCSLFIENNELDIIKLSEYLHKTQENKIYMLYKDGKFNIQYNDDNYNIVKVEKGKSKKTGKYTRYECETKNGRYINVLLRWKNNNGIAFPAFQISWSKN
jgi:hypothetical protein